MPTVSLSASTVKPGEVLTVTGADFFDGCDDTQDDPEAEPAKNVPVIWVQGDTQSTLASLAADGDGVVAGTVTVPAQAQAGEATLSVGIAEPLEVTVTP